MGALGCAGGLATRLYGPSKESERPMPSKKPTKKPTKKHAENKNARTGNVIDAGAVMLEAFRMLPPAYSCTFVIDGCRVTMARLARSHRKAAKPR